MHVKLLKQFKSNFLRTVTIQCCSGRCGGLILSALVSRASNSGSSPGRGHCVVFLTKHLTLTVPDTTQVYKWVRANFIAGVNPTPGVGRDTPSRFMALKQEIRSGLMGHVARLETLPTYLHIYLNY